MKIAYERHPVTAERKAELRAAGYKILDARFAPKGGPDGVQEKAQAKEVTGIPSKSDIATMKKADVIEWLDAHGVTGASGAVADLRDMLRRAIFVDVD